MNRDIPTTCPTYGCRTCKICGYSKPITDFVKFTSGGYSGYRSMCKGCRNKAAAHGPRKTFPARCSRCGVYCSSIEMHVCVPIPRSPLLDRFMEKVSPEPNSGCWLWLGSEWGKGYGSFVIERGKGCQAHRAAYELFVGPIPEGLQLDHKCRVHICVNPDHLEPVTQRENTIRGFISRGFGTREKYS